MGGEAVWTRSSLCSHHRGLFCVWIGQWRSVCKFQVSKETKLECFHDINHLVLFIHPSFPLCRMIFAAARDRNFPSLLCYLNVHSLIPTPPVILMVSGCLSPYRLKRFLVYPIKCELFFYTFQTKHIRITQLVPIQSLKGWQYQLENNKYVTLKV